MQLIRLKRSYSISQQKCQQIGACMARNLNNSSARFRTSVMPLATAGFTHILNLKATHLWISAQRWSMIWPLHESCLKDWEFRINQPNSSTSSVRVSSQAQYETCQGSAQWAVQCSEAATPTRNRQSRNQAWSRLTSRKTQRLSHPHPDLLPSSNRSKSRKRCSDSTMRYKIRSSSSSWKWCPPPLSSYFKCKPKRSKSKKASRSPCDLLTKRLGDLRWIECQVTISNEITH